MKENYRTAEPLVAGPPPVSYHPLSSVTRFPKYQSFQRISLSLEPLASVHLS